MKIKMIDFVKNSAEHGLKPTRAHYNDAGLDCYSTEDVILQPGQRQRIKLGFGIELPDGYVALLLPRSSMNAKGIRCEVGVIDSGYRGEIQAVIVNDTEEEIQIKKNDKISQLLVLPIVYADLAKELINDRNENGFGSTGK